MEKSSYIVKISGSADRGEYTGGKTLVEARMQARHMANHTKGAVSIVRFSFGKGLPEDGRMEVVERIKEGSF